MRVHHLISFAFLFSMELPLSAASCGYHKINSATIAGGAESSFAGKWPWLAFLEDAHGRHFCGGSLIARNVVLTAAHCGIPAKVRLGRYYTNEAVEGEQEAEVERRLVHPRYVHRRDQNNNTAQMEADIALLVLKKNVHFTNYVQPICLPSGDENPPDIGECAIAGWGVFARGSDPPYILQEADVTLGSCRDRLSRAHSVLCTEGHDVSTCEGDSGGPLACRRSRTAPWHVAGVVSYGICGQKSFFMKIAHFAPWIQARLTEIATPGVPLTCVKDGKTYSAGERFASGSWAYECVNDGDGDSKTKLIGCVDKDAPPPQTIFLNGDRFSRDGFVTECKIWTDAAGASHIQQTVVGCVDPSGNEHASGSTWDEFPRGASVGFTKVCHVENERGEVRDFSCKHRGVRIHPGECRQFGGLKIFCNRNHDQSLQPRMQECAFCSVFSEVGKLC